MMFASAMSQVKGKEFSYPMWCIAAQCCMPCAACCAYKELAPHYGIKESMWMCKGCLPLLSYYQLIDTIMVKEGLHMVTAGVAPDEPAAKAPPVVEMQR